ncbi:MAG TPA: nicotinate phosphoribosyltransferase, partial [Lacipirellulaceae bacterium]|nr:nicotinate phosphoribosyltransferase [Lacipirellulaceae bacterium]
VRQAVDVGRRLREMGHEMVGVRLDSGDLAYLSIEARKILDDAGFANAAIIASNDLDEHIMESLRTQGAPIAVWGVGTKLVTAYDQPALGGVYKLGALRYEDGSWQPKLKLSEQAVKTSIPGILQVRRFEVERGLVGDMIYDETQGVDERGIIVDIKDPTRRKTLKNRGVAADLLTPVIRGGEIIAPVEDLDEIRKRVQESLEKLHPTIRRLMNPHEYPVGLDVGLHERRDEMIREARHTKMEMAT